MSKLYVKSERHLKAVRESGRRLAQVMRVLGEAVAPGVTTAELDRIAEKEILRLGGVPIFKGYGAEYGTPFPATVCISLNEEVVHGIPRPDRTVKEGDLIKLDMGLRFDGMVTDMARTFAVGNISEEARKLLDVTRESLDLGISRLKPGARLSDYAGTVQHYVEANGFSVVRELVGHGVGFELHEEPQIPNYVSPRMYDFTFRKGMVVALEPMVNAGRHQVRMGKDGWTFVASDGSLSAHFEDTVIITEHGAEIVTRAL
jgi:methionyl aminopeptidase